jgi:AcrR family transcriptional regulator
MRAKDRTTIVRLAGQLRADRSPAEPQVRSRPSRNRQPNKTRDALLEAAARIFNSAGYHGTDSNRIAREAGYAPGTFYVHFADKLAIFLEVYEGWVSTEWTSIEAILKSGGTARELRKRLSRTVLEHHRKWRTFRASLRALSATDDRVHAARVASRARQIETMTRLLSTRGAPIPDRARMLAQLLIAEALCDAVADGDAASLGIGESEIVRILDESSRDLLADPT